MTYNYTVPVKRNFPRSNDFTNLSPGDHIRYPGDVTFDEWTYLSQSESAVSITSNQDNYDMGTDAILLLSSDASRTITGFSHTDDDGFERQGEMRIVNVGSNNIVLANQDSGSTAANRIITGNGADWTLYPNDAVDLFYDEINSRWRISGAWVSGMIREYREIKTMDLAGETVADIAAFNVTGVVRAKILAVVTTNFTAAGTTADATLDLTSDGATFIPKTDMGDMVAYRIWHDNEPRYEAVPVDTLREYFIADGANNTINVHIYDDVTAGALQLICLWAPMSAGATLTAA